MSSVEIEGLRIAFERAGQGPPLVLLPGFVGDGRATWSHQLDALSDEFTVVAWDPPGSGHSSDPPDSFRLTDYADCLARFVDVLELGRAHLAGLSFGGALALQLCGSYPHLVSTLVLAGGYAGWAGSFAPEIAAERLTLSLQVADLPPQQFVAALLPSMFSTSAPEAAVRAFADSVAQVHPAGFRVMARSMAESDLRGLLGSIDVPTLLLQAELDIRAPRQVADALRRAIPTSTLVVLPGTGHVSSVEAPELFTQEVRSFLHRHRDQAGKAPLTPPG